MPLLTFSDADGVEWRVFAVHSSAGRSTLVSEPGEEGWLAFETEGEKRRLWPVPRYWDRLDGAELAQLCAQAKPVAAETEELITQAAEEQLPPELYRRTRDFSVEARDGHQSAVTALLDFQRVLADEGIRLTREQFGAVRAVFIKYFFAESLSDLS